MHDAGFDRCRRREAGVARQIGDVGGSCRDIAGLQRLQIEHRLAAQGFFDAGDEVREFDRAVVADVVEPVRRRAGAGIGLGGIPRRIGLRDAIAGAHHALHDVVDVGEIALHLPVVEDRDRFTGEDRLGEEIQHHVGTAPRAVDGEEAQTGGRQAVQMAVTMRYQFIGLLGRRVQARWMVDIVMDAERQRAVEAVDRTGAGIGQVSDVVLPAAFQDVGEGDQIGVDIGMWMG